MSESNECRNCGCLDLRFVGQVKRRLPGRQWRHEWVRCEHCGTRMVRRVKIETETKPQSEIER
jgi:uncharacterized Zn finger protein